MRRLAAVAAIAALAGCAAAPPPRTEAARFAIDPARCVGSLAEAPVHPIRRVERDGKDGDAGKPLQFGELAACVRAGDGTPYPALVFAVDGTVPLQVDLAFYIEQDVAFAARIELLTADYRIVRSVPFAALARRGYSYTGSVFLNPADAAVRRLALVPDAAVVGRAEESTIGVSTQTMVAVPVPAGLVYFNVSSGNEVTTRSWLSEVGSFSISATPYQPPAASRPRQ